MRWEPLIRFPTAWTSVLGTFVVHLFEGHLSIAQMDHMQVMAERWLEQRNTKVVELVIIHPSDARMTHEERAHMARLIKFGETRRNASATVILAEGIVGSVQRSILTGLTMLVPPCHPAKVLGQVAPALDWLYPYLASSSTGAPAPNPSREELHVALKSHLDEFRRRPDRPAF